MTLCKQELAFFIDHQGQILSREPLPDCSGVASPHPVEVNGEKQLLLFSEALNLEKVIAVCRGLSPFLSFGQFSFKKSVDLSLDICITVGVKEHTEQSYTDALEALAVSQQVELVVLDGQPRLSEPGLLLMDMDSTVIAVECIDEIAKLAGVGQQVSEVTELAMQGKLDFAESLNNRVACLAGADESILQEVQAALPLMPGITRLVRILKLHNWKVAIASGGFTYFTDYLLARLELDAAVANQLEIDQGKLTGKVKGDIIDAKAKADTLLRLAKQWQIPVRQTIAMGDGANDLLMMEHAGLGVASHAKPLVRQQADTAIRFGGLDALLWMLAD